MVVRSSQGLIIIISTVLVLYLLHTVISRRTDRFQVDVDAHGIRSLSIDWCDWFTRVIGLIV